MNDFLRRLRHTLNKPAGINCRGICVNCVWFEICVEETAPELAHQDQPEQLPMPEEFRCCICQSRHDCPVFETGVIFPCAYYKEEGK